MRRLSFNHELIDHQKTFGTLYFGFIQGGINLNKDKDKKPRSEVRLEARIMEKLDVFCHEDTMKPIPWQLVKTGVLSFTDEEYEKIDKHLDNVNWPTGSARDVSRLFDFWGQAEKIDEVKSVHGNPHS